MRLLWLKYGELLPPDTGGKLRSYHLLRSLRDLVDLRFVSYVRPGASPGYGAALGAELPNARVVEIEGAVRGTASAVWNSATRDMPLTVSRFTSARLRTMLQREVARDPPDILLCDFLMPSASVPVVRSVPTILFQHNVESSLWRRKADSATGAKALLYRWEQRALERYESAMLRRFDATLCVSHADQVQFEQMAPGVRTAVVETGVDVAAFAPPPDNRRSAHDVVFIGSMDWQPNIQGVEWFVRDIWPRVIAACPDAVFHVVGRRPPAAIRRLEGPAIRISGDVASVAPHLHRAAVSVVPLLAGGGTRLKIYEAMAAGAPVVSTTVGAEGLDLVAGRDLLLADDPSDFAAAVVGVLQQPDRARSLSASATTLVQSVDWRSVAGRLAAVLRALAARS